MGDEQDLFSAAVQGAVPLANRERAKPPTQPRQVRVKPNENSAIVEDRDGRVTMRAANVSRRFVRDLCAGKHRPEGTLDLHRLSAERARSKLERFLTDSACDGQRCVLVVTGRGKGEHGGVLRTAVVEWVSGPLSRHVLALGSATAEDGGPGAYYVYLRRP
jgi:DNA-nicking Smr family endonuclease